MTLRQKLVIAFATVAVVVAALVGGFTYGLTAHNLRIEVDRSLATAATTLSAPGTLPLVTAPAAAADQQVAAPTPGAFIQTARVIASDGAVSQLLGLDVGLPVSTADQSLASSGSAGSRQYEDVTVGDRSSRVLTHSLGSVGGAIQVARELSQTSRLLGTLAFTIAVVGLLVLLVAAFAGWLVARHITRR
jgi:sensor histidine kinase regulating citrate/malate metabolism